MAAPYTTLSPELEQTLRDDNPWWRGERLPALPPFKRWAYEPALSRLKSGLAPVIALRGPRQVGKSTVLLQIIQQLLAEGVEPNRILRIQFDNLPASMGLREPILEIPRWFEHNVLGNFFNTAAHEGRPAYFFFDELQNLPYWSPQLKHLVDMRSVRGMITGSSALKIERGRDSLAGRLSTIEMGPLFLREIAAWRSFGEIPSFLAFNGLAQLKNKSFWQELRAFGEQHREIRRAAFSAFSERGAYPIAHVRADRPWEEIADQLNETVIRRVVRHDLRAGGKGRRRDVRLLEEVFRVGCRYIGQTPNAPLYYDEIKRAMGPEITWLRILNYLDVLNESLLLRLIEPLELRLKRRQGGGKLCLCDHALRASRLQEVVPLTEEGLAGQPHLSDLAGRIAESAAGYFISSILSLDVAHFPERNLEPEVDFILTVGEQRIPIEVKYRKRIDFNDTRGLRSFIEHSAYNAPFGLLLTLTDSADIDDPRIVQMPLSTFLLLR
jgi:hypothetical protein